MHVAKHLAKHLYTMPSILIIKGKEEMNIKKSLICIAIISTPLCAIPAEATVFLQGSATGNISSALNSLGVAYTAISGNAMSNTPAAGDTLIMSFDGGTDPFVDYRIKLDQGLDIIMFGGSNYQPFRDWASLYFNLTDTGSGWHQDGAWNTVNNNVATQYMLNTYAPENNSVTFHMLGFAATDNTTMLGVNDELVNIAAFREYLNGGSFNYLSMDPGPYGTTNDLNNFTIPYLRGALEAASAGLGNDGNSVPEPTTLALMGLGLAGVAASRSKGKSKQ